MMRNAGESAQRTWSVGELAKATGLTVRTLHHYDEQGLLHPSERTQAGHRRYAEKDVERLYRVVALRRLGLALGEIGGLLDGEEKDLASVVRRQLDQVEGQLGAQERLRGLLIRILDTLDRGGDPRVEEILKSIEVTTMIEKHYTPDQLDRLTRRREELGDEAIRGVEREWGEIFAALRAEMDAGTDPADPRLRPLGERAQELVRMFTGGEPDIADSLKRVWQNEHPQKVSHGMADAELMGYLHRVQAASGDGTTQHDPR